MIDSATRAFVAARAQHRCGYCHLPQAAYEATFCMDHVIALQHTQDDSTESLAFCCPRCNRKKGPNLAGVDPATLAVTVLFHPRRINWGDHFCWNGPHLISITATGRATASLLDLNMKNKFVCDARLSQIVFSRQIEYVE